MAKMKRYRSIPQYLADFDPPTTAKLSQLIEILDAELPQAEQTFAYGIPTYKLAGRNVVHFAAFKNHISLFPGPRAVAAFRSELAAYKTSKGTIQFPADRPLPLGLIRKIVRFAQKQNLT